MHTGQLVERVLDAVGDPEGTRFGVGQIVALLNNAQRVFLRETKTILRDRATLSCDTSLTPVGGFWTVPTDLVTIERLEVDGREIIPDDEKDMAARYRDWSSMSGLPYWFMFGAYGQALRIVPYPDFTSTPVLYYVKRAGDLGVSQEPDINPLHHMALAHHAIAWLKVNDETVADPTGAQTHMGDFNEAVAQASGDAAHRMVKGYRTSRKRWLT